MNKQAYYLVCDNFDCLVNPDVNYFHPYDQFVNDSSTFSIRRECGEFRIYGIKSSTTFCLLWVNIPTRELAEEIIEYYKSIEVLFI